MGAPTRLGLTLQGDINRFGLRSTKSALMSCVRLTLACFRPDVVGFGHVGADFGKFWSGFVQCSVGFGRHWANCGRTSSRFRLGSTKLGLDSNNWACFGQFLARVGQFRDDFGRICGLLSSRCCTPACFARPCPLTLSKVETLSRFHRNWGPDLRQRGNTCSVSVPE